MLHLYSLTRASMTVANFDIHVSARQSQIDSKQELSSQLLKMEGNREAAHESADGRGPP